MSKNVILDHIFSVTAAIFTVKHLLYEREGLENILDEHFTCLGKSYCIVF